MDSNEQMARYRALDLWFKTSQGVRVAQAFTDELAKYNEVLKGERLLQIGLGGDNIWLDSLAFRQKWLASSYRVQKAALVTSLQSLPLDKNSVDCVVAPLMIEAFPQDANPIDEIDRVLKSMGYVIFLGINPWSFWGAALKWGKHACFGQSKGTLTTSLSLKHAMLERGYQQCALSSFYYIPPVTHPSLVHGLEFLNVMGKMIWPFPPGFYCLILQKHLSCPSAWLRDLNTEPFLLRRSLQVSHRTIHLNK